MCKDCWTCENLFSLNALNRRKAETSSQKCVCVGNSCPFSNVTETYLNCQKNYLRKYKKKNDMKKNQTKSVEEDRNLTGSERTIENLTRQVEKAQKLMGKSENNKA